MLVQGALIDGFWLPPDTKLVSLPLAGTERI
jgi:hypothetical protein